MKKVIIILVLVAVCAGIGTVYYFNEKKENDELSSKISEAAISYFDKYVSVNDSKSMYKITLKMLKDTDENYDLAGFDGCDEEKTSATVFVNYKNGKAKKTEVLLNCK